MRPVFGRHTVASESKESEEVSNLQLNLGAAQQEQINKTTRLNIDANTVKKHNRNITKFYKWFLIEVEKNPDFFEGNINSLFVAINYEAFDDKEELLESELRSGEKTYRSFDIVYENLPPQLVKLYCTSPERKYKWTIKAGQITGPMLNSEGKHLKNGFDVHRKFLESIDFGRRVAKAKFPKNYVLDIEKFKSGLKKENAKNKSDGDILEREADPIPFDLYRFMCESAINSGNAFWWLFSILQWSCLGRCQNIDDLTFRNLSLGSDSIIVKFDATKMDKTGDKCSPKNCYANPLDFILCINTALAVYLSLEKNSTWSKENKSFLFINPGAKQGSAASRYTDSIQSWVNQNYERIASFMRIEHLDPYSVRKGSATYASSGTTMPPPIPSLFHRGEWSLGVILDIYWKFAEAGDHYLGRILAGLDPCSDKFGILPPHFTVPIENDIVQEGMNLCFGNIYRIEHDQNNEGNSFVKGILGRCLASLVYHADELQSLIAKRGDTHPFNNLTLLQHPTLLEQLKLLVTTEPTENIMSKATGVPPHTETIKELRTIIDMFLDFKQKWEEGFESLKNVVNDAIEQKMASNGHLSSQSLTDAMDTLYKKWECTFESKFHQFAQKYGLDRNGSGSNNTDNNTMNNRNESQHDLEGRFQTYCWNGKLGMHVPPGFDLPASTKLFSAWSLWINGNPGHKSFDNSGSNVLVSTPIRPFQLFTSNAVPQSVWKKLKSGWFKVLNMMMEAPELSALDRLIKTKGGAFSIDEIKGFYEKGVTHVLNQVEYIKALNSASWTVTTWSGRVSFKQIMEKGTDADKNRLPDETRYNQPHRQKRKMQQSNMHVSLMRRIGSA